MGAFEGVYRGEGMYMGMSEGGCIEVSREACVAVSCVVSFGGKN